MSAGHVYASGEQVKAALKNQDVDALTKALVLLRNQLSFNINQPLPPQDSRLILAQQWLIASPGAHELFTLWENAEPRQTAFISVILSVLAALLNLLTTHYPYHTHGHPIAKKLLEPTYTRVLKCYIGGATHDLILSSLKLYNSVSRFSSGRERKTVLDVFPWELKSLPRLMNMRRKAKADDPLDKPDIRTLYILLMLSFIDHSSTTSTKSIFLEQHRDAFITIFKGMHQDPYAVIRKILETCWSGMWNDSKLKRTVKITVFNEITLTQLSKIYDRTEDDGGIPADVVHHFLLAICTHPGTGVCFKDNGWYPRETTEDHRPFAEDGAEASTKSKIYNKILSNLLRNLKPNEDSRQQELTLKILAACPELVAGFWSGAGLTLEPRLSSRWFTNIAIFSSVVTLPVPTSSFVLPNSIMYRPIPPPLSNIIESILPTPLGKVFLAKALQPTARSLVQHTTALALCRCLAKLRDVLVRFQSISEALEETEEDGLWAKRRRDLEREARKRIPDFQVIVAFAQRTSGGDPKTRLLAESSHRLLWLYHHCLPEMVSEARFDVGKLLVHFQPNEGDEDSDKESNDLDVLKQMHILRILEISDQFVWTAKYGSSKQSSIYILLKMLLSTRIEAIHSTLTRLIKHLLSESIIFQDNSDEIDLWLISLPISRRSPGGGEAPDGAPLTDEATGVLTFLEECIQRCIKTPYKYIEEMHAYQSPSQSPKAASGPSPLLVTVKEQFIAKLNAKTISVSDTLAIATFIRKLLFRLNNAITDITFTSRFCEGILKALHPDNLFPDFPLVTGAIVKEAETIKYCLGHLQLAPLSLPTRVGKDVRDFLTAVEKLEPPATESARINSAFELVDWLRLLDQPIRSSEMMRLVLIVHRYHPPAVRELVQSVNPGYNIIWDGSSPAQEIQAHVDFEWLFVSSNKEQLEERGRHRVLLDTAFGPGASVASIGRCLGQVEHALAVALHSDTLTAALLQLMDDILSRASTTWPSDYATLKERVFVSCQPIRQLSLSPSLSSCVSEALKDLVQHNLDTSSADDRHLVSEVALHWAEVVSDPSNDHVTLATSWIPFLEMGALLELSVILGQRAAGHQLLDITLRALKLHAVSVTPFLGSHLGELMSLRTSCPSSDVLEDLLASSLDALQPMFLDGRSQPEFSITADLLHRAEQQWNLRFQRLPEELQLSTFLEQSEWTGSTVSIMRCLVYRGHSTRSIMAWLQTGNHEMREPVLLVDLLHAFLDTANCRGENIEEDDSGCWLEISRLLVGWSFDPKSADGLRKQSMSCVALLFSMLQARSGEMSRILVDELGNVPKKWLSADLLRLGQAAVPHCPSFASALVERGAQWAIRTLGDELLEESTSQLTVDALSRLLELSPPSPPHIFEPLLTVITQSQLSNLHSLRLLRAVLERVSFKPLIVNRVLQSIVQSHRFVKHCSATVGADTPLREALVDVLHILFNLHPANTCQVSHVVPLIQIYYGTTSIADRKLFSIFHLFESQRKTSVATLFAHWDASPDGSSSNCLEAIQTLDPALLLRTCTQFPVWRKVEDQVMENTDISSVTYDPVFIILIFAHMLESPPQSTFAWIELFRTNIVGVLITALSAKDDHVRELSLCALAALWKQLEDADMLEATPVKHILYLLRNEVPPPTPGETCRRLPKYTTLLLAHSLRGIFYPHLFLYPITARFLLQRPELDSTDVPMLFGMLYSSSDDWKKERAWMIHFLADGLVSSEDWKVFKRRHTWDLLASMFQSSNDRSLRKTIFEVLANLTCIRHAATSLVLKSGLLAWIEMQLKGVVDEEAVLWLKILENILTVPNTQQLEASTNGQWRWSISRCLELILECPSSRKRNVLSLASRVILRLSMCSPSAGSDVAGLLDTAFERLQEMEEIELCAAPSVASRPYQLPHSKSTLHEDQADEWGRIVETLWRVSMTLQEKHEKWDFLTSRLLVWRASVQEKQNVVTLDWVRVETVVDNNTADKI